MATEFLYETHLHTSEVSRCATASARQQVEFYHRRGYAGVCVTDHFLNGHMNVPQDLPWEERVRLFCRGYDAAKVAAKPLGMQVFFGWEYPIQGTDLLTYGLSPAWLAAHPEIMEVEPHKYGDFVHAHGGFVIHAHPFREAHYIPMIRLMPRQVDGVEIVNANRTDFENDAARDYAKRYGLLNSCGSDNHTAEAQARLCALVSEHPLRTVEDLIALIRSGTAEIRVMDGGEPTL